MSTPTPPPTDDEPTKLSVPMTRGQREQLNTEAAAEAKRLGLTKLPAAEWARKVLFERAGIKL